MKIKAIPGEHLSEIVTEDGAQIGTALNEAAAEIVTRWNLVEGYQMYCDSPEVPTDEPT